MPPRPLRAAPTARHAVAGALALALAACASSAPRADAPAPTPAPTAAAVPATPAPPAAPPAPGTVPPTPGAETYVDQLLAAHGHRVVRWVRPDGRSIRVWVPAAPPAAGAADPAASVAAAMAAWNDVGLPVRFAPAASAAEADVVVRWVRTDAEAAVAGRARLRIDAADHVRSAALALTTHAASGHPHAPTAMLGYALHELGHALGLQHTGRPDCVMFPLPQRAALCPADVETARRWYAMPTGLVAAGGGG